MAKALRKIQTVNNQGAGGGYNFQVEITPADLSTSTGEEFVYLTLGSGKSTPALFAGTIRRASITILEKFSGGTLSDATISIGLGDGSTTNGGGTSEDVDAIVAPVNCFSTDDTEGLEFINTGTDLDDAFGKVVAASGDTSVLAVVSNGTTVGLGSATQGKALLKFDISDVAAGV
jgi:hypothetical protein